MTQEQKQVLDSYLEWRERRSTETPDLSTAAYLAELEAEADARRIREAVQHLGRLYDADGSTDPARFFEGVRAAFDSLVDDRDTVEDINLGSGTINTRIV